MFINIQISIIIRLKKTEIKHKCYILWNVKKKKNISFSVEEKEKFSQNPLYTYLVLSWRVSNFGVAVLGIY